MRIVKKGDIYKRQSWLKEHSDIIIIALSVILVYAFVAIHFIFWR